MWRLAPLVLISVGFLSCGYHTSAKNVTISDNVRTIAIPTFGNETQTFRVEQMMTAAVVREMLTRTHYHIVNKADADADATLRGTVLAIYTTPMTYDPTTGRAVSVLVVVSARIALIDKHGKVLYQNPNYLFREQYEVSRDLTSFFEEDSPAFERLSRDFARTVVANLMEGF